MSHPDFVSTLSTKWKDMDHMVQNYAYEFVLLPDLVPDALVNMRRTSPVSTVELRDQWRNEISDEEAIRNEDELLNGPLITLHKSTEVGAPRMTLGELLRSRIRKSTDNKLQMLGSFRFYPNSVASKFSCMLVENKIVTGISVEHARVGKTIVCKNHGLTNKPGRPGSVFVARIPLTEAEKQIPFRFSPNEYLPPTPEEEVKR